MIELAVLLAITGRTDREVKVAKLIILVSCLVMESPPRLAFFIFEMCVGIYFPMMGTMKGQIVPESLPKLRRGFSSHSGGSGQSLGGVKDFCFSDICKQNAAHAAMLMV